ncbi:5-oxoprolinase subunit PxpB [Algoriphagus sp.]|uniref:5-oxoprolinase subunit PxpB n=1 Tax=Algoriphagus sp. TaxID=1872435 RepID=UPI003F71AC02
MKPQIRQITPLLYEFGWDSDISDNLLQQQLGFKELIEHEFNRWIEELRLGYKTLVIVLSRPLEAAVVNHWVRSIREEELSWQLPDRIWKIPVCYSPSTGRDLENIIVQKNINREELIFMHSQPLYRIHFFGFLPGFMYLNGLNEKLHTPRKSIPDRMVPSGSVAIGGAQTGIYPTSSPGGWHLIGQTPISTFDPAQKKPVFASIGERITFMPISEREFDRIKMKSEMPRSI